MNEDCCFIDTTVLTEALLKSREDRKTARAIIERYDRSRVPVFAIKELKCGPMKHYIWLHNKFAESRSLVRTIRAIRRNFRRHYLQNTALEAFEVGAELLIGSKLASAVTRRQTDEALADSLRYWIRRRIDIAWRERRRIGSEVSDELSCFAEVAHSFNERTGLIDDDARKCDLEETCCLAAGFRKRKGDLSRLLKAMSGLGRPEDNRRRKAIHLLLNTPKKRFCDLECKALGDAIFALQCPSGCTILTSNVKDHELLAGALGRQVHQYKAP